MIAETLIIGLLILAGLWLLVGGRHSASIRGQKVFALVLLAAAISVSLAILTSDSRPLLESEVRGRPISVAGDGYVTSTTCRACHPAQYASWHASYHRTMTQVATTTTVVGDFENIDPRLADHLQRKGDQYFVRFGPRDSLLAVESPIVMITGSHHYQAYWYEGGQGRRLKLVPAIYLIDQQRWIPRDAAFLTPPDTSATTLIGEWNANCIKCHTTHGQPRVANVMGQTADARLDTHVAEFGISCEACHGPAEDHVRVYHSPLQRYLKHWDNDADSTIVQPARLDHQRASQVCGQCHSVFEFASDEAILEYSQNGFKYRPGDDLDETRIIVRPKAKDSLRDLVTSDDELSEYIAQRFWSDGMVRVSGREFNGLIESPCYQRGQLSCLSCHEMHKAVDDPRPLKEWANDQLKLGMEANQACLQCHSNFARDISVHTHHPPASSGSLCYNCHMPHTTYGLMKAMRSHQIDSPSVQNTLATGRPNACNLCHLDKTLAWTADNLTRWYDEPPVELSDDQQTVAASVLWALRGDAGQRALVSWSLGWGPAQAASGTDWMAPFLAILLDDPYDAVRFIAHRSLISLPEYVNFEFDFMTPQKSRDAARGRVLRMWQSTGDAKRQQRGAEVLLDANGELQQSTVKRLLQQRDMREVNLAE